MFRIHYSGGPENLTVRGVLRGKRLPTKRLEAAGIRDLGTAFALIHELADIPGVGPKTLAALVEVLDKYRASLSVRHWPRREGAGAKLVRDMYRPLPLLDRIQKEPRIRGLDAWLTTKD